MTKYQVGDRVIFKTARDKTHFLNGTHGTIIAIDRGSYCFKSDVRNRRLHDLDGLCEYGFGWYVDGPELALAHIPYDPSQEKEDDCL